MTTAPDSAETRPLARPLSGPHRGGVRQATFVEMHRAQAEVVAAVMAAREMPRDVPDAVADMKAGCRRRSMANKAFYRYSRGGKPITGGTIQLARFLASCWGNMQYGLTELSRDDAESQMQAWAWDLQKNNRPTTTFIVPHGRISSEEYRALTDPRDVYENNANMGARRVREMIFAVLPPWFHEEAVLLCRKTLAEGEEGEEKVEFPVRVANMLDAFAKVGVTRRQVEEKQGRSVDEFTPDDVATLTVVYSALRRGETTRDDEFPAGRVLPGDVPPTSRPSPEGQAGQGAPAATAEELPDGPVQEEQPTPARPAEARRRTRGKPSTEAQRGHFLGLMREAGPTGLLAALFVAAELAEGVTAPRGSLTEFSTVDLSQVINTLTGWKRDDVLSARVDALLPDEGDAAWQPVEAARAAYLAANGRSTEGTGGNTRAEPGYGAEDGGGAES